MEPEGSKVLNSVYVKKIIFNGLDNIRQYCNFLLDFVVYTVTFSRYHRFKTKYQSDETPDQL